MQPPRIAQLLHACIRDCLALQRRTVYIIYYYAKRLQSKRLDAAMRERDVWTKVRNGVQPPQILERIELGYKAGFPDVLGVYEGRAVFLELKYVSIQYAINKPHRRYGKVTPIQLHKLFDLHSKGALSYLVVGYGEERLTEFAIWRGADGRNIYNAMKLKTDESFVPPFAYYESSQFTFDFIRDDIH